MNLQNHLIMTSEIKTLMLKLIKQQFRLLSLSKFRHVFLIRSWRDRRDIYTCLSGPHRSVWPRGPPHVKRDVTPMRSKHFYTRLSKVTNFHHNFHHNFARQRIFCLVLRHSAWNKLQPVVFSSWVSILWMSDSWWIVFGKGNFHKVGVKLTFFNIYFLDNLVGNPIFSGLV